MEEKHNDFEFTMEEWNICLKVLEKLKDNPYRNPDNQRFGALITKIHKTAKKQTKRENLFQLRQDDLDAIYKTEIVKNALNNTSNYSADKPLETPTYSNLKKARGCYICTNQFDQLHSFYHRLCPSCAEHNYQNRFLEPDLSGRKVILTGGRIKVGYATALKILRANANVIITTRFPGLALELMQKEKDYHVWEENLSIYGLDLRNIKAVEEFVQFYQSQHHSLDILINNAAQTIKYTDDYYLPLIQKEAKLLEEHSDAKKLIVNKTPILESPKTLLEAANIDQDYPTSRFGQPVDHREKTSWNSTLEEIPLRELLEVNLINQISPYLLIQGLLPLFKASSFKEKFIINVSSSEGQFSYANKTIFHPHTNMTKAALNMLTRTSAEGYAKEDIYMNGVDVGWVSTGATEPLRKQQLKRGYSPPLDPVDAAARIIHPIFEALINKKYYYWETVEKLPYRRLVEKYVKNVGVTETLWPVKPGL